MSNDLHRSRGVEPLLLSWPVELDFVWPEERGKAHATAPSPHRRPARLHRQIAGTDEPAARRWHEAWHSPGRLSSRRALPRRRSRKVTWCRRLSWEGWVEETPVQDQLPVVKAPTLERGRLVGQKRPLLPKQVWAIRARLELSGNLRDLVLFNLAIDSKPRGCGRVRLKVAELIVDERVRSVSPSSRARPSGRCSSRSPRTSATRSGSGSRGPRGVPFGSAPPVGRARPVSQDICPSIWYHFLIKR